MIDLYVKQIGSNRSEDFNQLIDFYINECDCHTIKILDFIELCKAIIFYKFQFS